MHPRAIVLGLAVAGVLASSCATSSDDGRASESIGQQAVEAMDSGRDAGCTTDKRLVETALLAHYTLLGYDATTMGDLLQFGVENESDRWTLKIPTDATDTAPAVVATVGGPCDS